MPFTAFIFGFLAATLALVLELIIITPGSFPEATALSWSIGSITILVLIAIIEETCKYLFLFQHRRQSAPDAASHATHPFFFGILFGLGFAVLEITLASYDTSLSPNGSGLLGIAFLHVATSLTLVLLMDRFGRSSRGILLIPLILAIVIHLLYNGFLSFVAS